MPASSTTPACIVITLAAAKALSMYRISGLDASDAPTEFAFEGSNDGETWTELDWRTLEAWTDNQTRDFPVISSTAYKYFRLRVIVTDSGTAFFSSIDLFERIASKTYHGSGESDQGCEVALTIAKDAAEASAAADLNAYCRQVFTATASKTKPCENGIGSVTASGAGASFESLADAVKQADDEAEAKANVLLAQCAGSNNGLPITIPHIGVASPYPSVQNIEGKTGVITNVIVNINGFSHGSAEDVHILLESPTGTVVELMSRCGGLNVAVGGGTQAGPVPPGINLIFADAAVDSLPDAVTYPAGTYKPTQYGVQTDAPVPAPQSPYSLTLAAFNGEDANGAWKLWISDRIAVYPGAIFAGWSLTIATA